MPNHPELTKKFKLLYHLRVNPGISSNTDLAIELGITKQAISRWIHGCETNAGNHIPVSQIKKLASLFQIKLHWFALPYQEFEALIFDKLEAQEQFKSARPNKISISQLPVTSADVFGRESALEELNLAWRQQDTNVVQLVAFGGVGKSCLVNYWLASLNEKNYLGAKQIYAWSFYWQGAANDFRSSGDFFIEHALEWFGDKEPSRGTPWAKASRLAKLIRETKTLLILDGLEPMQYPPGPKSGHIENPAVAFLIKELAVENNGLCVISTRLPIADLESYRDERVRTLNLDHLSVEASVALLKCLGVRGTDEYLQETVRKYSCHPLSLTLLAGYLNVVYQGEIHQIREMKSLFEEQSQGQHAKNIMRAYLEWFKSTPERALLLLIGLLDRATSISELKAIVALDEIAGLTSELRGLTHAQWSYAVKRLCDANLISIQEIARSRVLECHPLVKEYSVLQLKNENEANWRAGNRLLFNYYHKNVPEYPENITEMDNLFRAIMHGTKAGLYREAFQMYFFRIKNGYTMLSRGSHYSDQSCLRAFFKEPWSTPVEDLAEEEQIHLFSSLAANQISLGNIKEAIEPAEKSLTWFLANERWFEAASYAGPYISMLIAVGRLDEANMVMDSLDHCVENTKNTVLLAVAQTFHAYVKYLGGDFASAGDMFVKADRVLTSLEPDSPVAFPTISSYYCKFLLETGNFQNALDRLLKTFGWRKRRTWQVVIDTPSIFASDLLVLGLTFLARNDLVNAKKYLDQQVELFRSADEWLYLPTGLHSRARYFIKICNFDAAITDLEEALRITTRTGAVFGEWESYLNFAHLYRVREEAALCNHYLQKAASLPNMQLYKFRDVEIDRMVQYVNSASAFITDEVRDASVQTEGCKSAFNR